MFLGKIVLSYINISGRVELNIERMCLEIPLQVTFKCFASSNSDMTLYAFLMIFALSTNSLYFVLIFTYGS